MEGGAGKARDQQEGREVYSQAVLKAPSNLWNVRQFYWKVLLSLRHILLKNFLDWKNPVL